MKFKYLWQGEPVSVKYGYVVQCENKEKVMFWYNFECNTKQPLNGYREPDHMVMDNGDHFSLIPAIEVTYQDQTFTLANHYGIGISKLLKGGWPNHAHFSLMGEFKESNEPWFKITSFDLEGYEKHESDRRNWQKKEYPEQFEKMEALRRGAQKYSSSFHANTL